MGIQKTKVVWLGRDVDGTIGEPIDFDDCESISIKRDSDDKESYASITLKNVYDRFRTGFTQPFTKYNQNTNDIRFKEGDTIKIYSAYLTDYRELDTSSDSADLLMTGEIAEVNIKGRNKSSKVTLKCVDKTYIILNRLYPEVITSSQNLTAPLIVQKIARFVTHDVESDPLSYDGSGNLVANGIYGVDARLVSEGTVSNPGYIEDTRIDGSSFPTISMAKAYKPAYDWIKDLSAIENTNDFTGSDDADAPTQDRNMLFYIDEKNRFHWYYPKEVLTTTLATTITASSTTIALTSGTDFPSQGTFFIGTERIDYLTKSGNNFTNLTRGANNTIAAAHSSGDTVRNAISIIEGDTSSGYTLEEFDLTKLTFDIVNFVIFSCGSDMYGNGITNYFFDRTTKSKSLKDTFKSYNDIGSQLMQKEISDGRLIEDNATTSAFTFKGNRYRVNSYPVTTSWGVGVVSNDEYNDAFRDKCISLGRARAQALTQKRGSPRWKGTLDFKYHRFTPGDLFQFTSTRAGINRQSLRIKSVIYNIDKAGAKVNLTVEEDEAKLGGN